jgi:hypothetical protein
MTSWKCADPVVSISGERCFQRRRLLVWERCILGGGGDAMEAPNPGAEAGGTHEEVVDGVRLARGRNSGTTARGGELAGADDVQEQKPVACTGRWLVASISSGGACGGGRRRCRGTRGGGGRRWRERSCGEKQGIMR